ncbi:nuclear transport factor 2 family protein [Chloroflexota bacterium]
MTPKSLEERITRLEDIHEIQNLMSRYEYYHSAGMLEETVQLFAQKTPGVTAEAGIRGVYEGIEGIRRLYFEVLKKKNPTGNLVEHDLTTPVIEVAGDGKTAKGLWLSPGLLTARDDETDELNAFWDWTKYEVDFVKEDGKWKVWHFHVYLTFCTPYDEGWVKSMVKVKSSPEIPDELKPDKPTTYHKPYNPSGLAELVPAPPEPYETY